MDHLVLKEVGFGNLKKGTKYIIKRCNEIQFIGNFNNYNDTNESCASFDHAYSIHGEMKLFVWKINFYDKGSRYKISHKYYKVIYQKEKIQQTMELRSINIILQRIIGDASFVY
jgi:hypothetical protein